METGIVRYIGMYVFGGEETRGMKRLASALLAMVMLLACGALAEATELSDWYGRDIAGAAEAVGGLQYAAGEEFPDNYEGGGVALRGDGVVALIDLEAGAQDYALCGVSVGMKRADVLARMEGYGRLWDYDEEAAWIVVPDEVDPLNSRMLVAFFDDAGKVSGLWYRSSEG